MEIGQQAIRPAQAEAGAVPRVGAPSPASSVATELPPALAVQQPSGLAETALGAGHRGWAEPAGASVERTLTIDPQTRLLVSQTYDRDTGELLSQVPDQALLRLKAYAREAVAELDARAAARRVQRIA